jgi:hypothetical protein
MNEAILSGADWRKSSYSSANGQCVEAALLGDAVAARDSKDPMGPALLFPADAWTAFLADVKAGRYS